MHHTVASLFVQPRHACLKLYTAPFVHKDVLVVPWSENTYCGTHQPLDFVQQPRSVHVSVQPESLTCACACSQALNGISQPIQQALLEFRWRIPLIFSSISSISSASSAFSKMWLTFRCMGAGLPAATTAAVLKLCNPVATLSLLLSCKLGGCGPNDAGLNPVVKEHVGQHCGNRCKGLGTVLYKILGVE